MSYLDPPPQPAPVVVVKDVGGVVRDYEAQTAVYRATGREVRLHECRSACTLALSLPNVCVYPDSVLKFHQAYNLLTRQADLGVSRELFYSYPAAVRARLGTLTRDYRVLSGAALIKLGVRNCEQPREAPVLLAATKPQSLSAPGFTLSGFVHGVMASLNGEQQAATKGPRIWTPQPAAEPEVADVPLPPRRPLSLSVAYVRPLPVAVLPRVITGAQPILPVGFSAYAEIARR